MEMTYGMFDILAYFFGGMLVGTFVFYVYHVFFRKQRERILTKEMNRVLNKAKSEAYRIEKRAELKAKDLQIKLQNEAKSQIAEEKKALQEERDSLQVKESNLKVEHDQKVNEYKSKLEDVKNLEESLEEKNKHLQTLSEKKQKEVKELSQKLENVSQMTQAEAREELKKALSEEMASELSTKLQAIEKEYQEKSKEKCQHILATAIARQASAVTTERTIDRLPVAGDEVKGKIIGREGRNIRALEHACGVDILIEEGQDSISISCFDPIRREVAKKSITRLIKDGRVHPSRIEEIVEKVKSEVFQFMKEEGEKACFELNVHNVHPEIVKVLGGLTFKTLEGQNALQTSVEMAYLAGHIMAELGGDEARARRAGLLHCVGLNLDHRVEGHYAQAGAEFIKKYRENEDIVQAVLCHSSHVEAQSVLDHVLQTSFNLFQSLPSSKRSNIESYMSRMKKVESIANSFSGVIRSFAIQAGKELRVLVDSSQVTDDQTNMLCLDISKKIERELQQSYHIKVSVVRESRIVEYAR